MIEPTEGRSLHYRPTKQEETEIPVNPGKPLACILAGVQSSTHVNLCVFDSNGHPHPRQNVLLVQDGEIPPEGGGYAEWMPYQNMKVNTEFKEPSKLEEMFKSLTKR